MPALGDAPFVASLGSEQSANDGDPRWVGGELDAAARSGRGGRAGARAVLRRTGALPRAGRRGLPRGRRRSAGSSCLRGDRARALVPLALRAAHAFRPARASWRRSPAGPAAFRKGRHLGVQFHPEVTAEVVADWSRSVAELEKLGIDPPALVAETRAARPAGAAAGLRALRLLVGRLKARGGVVDCVDDRADVVVAGAVVDDAGAQARDPSTVAGASRICASALISARERGVVGLRVGARPAGAGGSTPRTAAARRAARARGPRGSGSASRRAWRRLRSIASRIASAPWTRNASHSFSALSGREYSSVRSTGAVSSRSVWGM